MQHGERERGTRAQTQRLSHIQYSRNKWCLAMAAGQYTRPRTRSSVTIWHLPSELLLQIFEGIHIRDLLSLRQVCTRLHQITDSNPSLWARASFFHSWPCTDSNLQIFNKAANHGNFEALIKLAIAKLYNEGLSEEQKKFTLQEKARQASEHFCQAEQVTSAVPFTWLFIKPPWAAAPNALSCKSFVFEDIKERAEGAHPKKMARAMAICVAKILTMLDRQEEAAVYFQRAQDLGSNEARLIQWLGKHEAFLNSEEPMEVGTEIEVVRQLRSIVVKHDTEAELMLCECYAAGKLGGITPQQAFAFTREVFQSSSPVNYLPMLREPHELDACMRYILVDWMVEVANMKNFTPLALHNAVAMVDRCLKVRVFSRAMVQLLGVSAMVITSRAMDQQIMTIKEAAWLTDQTYTYAEVVRMMGEIMAILGGHVRFMTSCDFAHALVPVTGLGSRGMCVVDYLSELSLLQAHLAKYSPAEVAASCVLLAHVLLKDEEVWPRKMEEATGFCRQDLTRCVYDIHEKCLLEGTRFDQRNHPLQAVKARYSEDNCLFNMAEIEVVSQNDLKNKLGMVYPSERTAKSKVKLRRAEKLICSPSRGKQRSRRLSELLRPSRDEASTPPADAGYEGEFEEDTDPFDLNGDLNDSFGSMRSEDTDSELRTEPFSEPSSEMDPFHQNKACDNSYIPAFAQIFFSSPFAPQICVSNCSCSSCSSSPSPRFASSQSPGAASSSSASAPSQYSSHPLASAAPRARPDDEDEEDNVSLGFSFADDHFPEEETADAEEDELVAEDLRGRNQVGNGSMQVWLQPPVAESTLGGGEGHCFAPINNHSRKGWGEQGCDVTEGKQGHGKRNLGFRQQEQDFDRQFQAFGEQEHGFVEHKQGCGEQDQGLGEQGKGSREQVQDRAPGGYVLQLKYMNPEGFMQTNKSPVSPITSQVLQGEFVVHSPSFPEGVIMRPKKHSSVTEVQHVNQAAGFVDNENCVTPEGGVAECEGGLVHNKVAAQQEAVAQDRHCPSQIQDCIVEVGSTGHGQDRIQGQCVVPDERVDRDDGTQNEKHWGRLCSGRHACLGFPVDASSPHREEEGSVIGDGDDGMPVRRQSPSSSTQASPKYEGSGKAGTPGKRSPTSPQKRKRSSSDNHVFPFSESVLQEDEMNGPSNKESSGTRKSPRTPTGVSFPNALQTKRQRRHSSHTQD